MEDFLHHSGEIWRAMNVSWGDLGEAFAQQRVLCFWKMRGASFGVIGTTSCALIVFFVLTGRRRLSSSWSIEMCIFHRNRVRKFGSSLCAAAQLSPFSFTSSNPQGPASFRAKWAFRKFPSLLALPAGRDSHLAPLSSSRTVKW